jgi:predicted Zn-dependent protease with MMP-like domain
MSVEGMKRAGIIHAVGEHFGINSEGMNPAEVVAVIREKQ